MAVGVHATLRTQGSGACRGRIERLMCRYGIRAIMARRWVSTNDSRLNLQVLNLKRASLHRCSSGLAGIDYIPTVGLALRSCHHGFFSRKMIGWVDAASSP
jgi:putative transposase